MVIDLIASLLLGSGLSVVITPQLLKIFHLNFFTGSFSRTVPAFSSEIMMAKNFDLTDFAATLLLSGFIFLLNNTANRKLTSSRYISYWYLAFAFLIFLQTHFVFTSGTVLLLFFLIVQSLYIFSKIKQLSPVIDFNWQLLANGIFTGFYLLLAVNKFTSIPSVLLFILISLPLLYIAFGNKYRKLFFSPGHLFYLLAVFDPLSPFWLLLSGIISLAAIFILRSVNRMPGFLYPAAVIFLFAYNPAYYVGNYDAVEEGFWSAWNQRLILGQIPYRDFLVYHPPFLLWGLHLFTSVLGFTLKNQKLFFHLLQITGVIIFYSLSRLLVAKPAHRILLILAALSFSGITVSNNFEIRLGLGLLAMLFWAEKKPLPAGAFTAFALFTSLEVGLVVFLVLLPASFLSKSGMKYLLGFLGVCLPVFLYLYFQGAVAGFISQLFYYSRAFSSGYFNTPVDRQFQSAYLHWHIFNQYVSSDNPILWEITKLTIFGSFLFSGFKLITGKITPSERLVFVVSLFSLGLFRSALGRSDFYHLLPLVWLALLLIVHYLNKFTPLLLVFLLLIFARVPINANYSENYIYRLQTYGRQIGEWRNFTTPRSGLLLGNTVDTYTLNDIVKYISENSQPSDSVFIYPWDPELYFLADRKNSTSLDTPYAFFTPEYQQQTIRELQMHPPKFIVYNPQKYFGGMTPGWLPLLTSYITSTYSHPAAVFGKYQILTL